MTTPTHKPGHPVRRPTAEACGRPKTGGANQTDRGQPCKHPAGWGTPNRSGPCRLHGGTLPSIQAAAAKKDAEAYAQVALTRLGLWGNRQDDARPLQQLAEELSRTAGRVGALKKELVRRESTAHERELDALAHELQAERGHLLQVAEAARRAGLAEHEVEVQQQQGQMLAAAFQTVLQLLELTPDQHTTAGRLLIWAMQGADPDTRPPTPAELRHDREVVTAQTRELIARSEAAEEQARREHAERVAARQSQWAEEDRGYSRLRKTRKHPAGTSGGK